MDELEPTAGSSSAKHPHSFSSTISESDSEDWSLGPGCPQDCLPPVQAVGTLHNDGLAEAGFGFDTTSAPLATDGYNCFDASTFSSQLSPAETTLVEPPSILDVAPWPSYPPSHHSLLPLSSIPAVAPSIIISTPMAQSSRMNEQPSSRQRARDISVETVQWRVNSANGYWEVLCPRCDVWISTGSRKSRNLQPLRGHLARKKDCKLRRAQDLHAAPPIQPSHTSSVMTSLPLLNVNIETPSKFASHSYAWDSEDDEDDMAAPLAQLDLQLAPSTGHPPSCTGIPLDWPLANFWATYPFQRHNDPSGSLGYHFTQFAHNGSQPWIRSNSCTGLALSDGSACLECQATRRKRDQLAVLAQHVLPHTNNKLRTHQQLCDHIRKMQDDLQAWKMKMMNLTRQHSLMLTKLDDHRRLVMAVAENKIPRVQQILRQGVKEGAGVSTIVGKLEESLCGVYKARKYDSEDLDLSLLVLRIGGRKLLYAMSQQIAIPSIRTLRRHAVFTKLTPSLGTPSLQEITTNIDTIFTSKAPAVMAVESNSSSFVSGICIQWDEISIEEVTDWFPHSDMVGGLCREHSAGVDASLSTFDHAVSIAQALHDGVVHLGKEASVIAVSSFGTALRGVFPVLVSPTCKAESPHDSAALLRKVIQAWKKSAAPQFGPIWSFASDGDAGRRAMVYQLFMKHTIDHRHHLFKYVGRLPGFNRQVGDSDITGDFDWKHELKRAGRLLRTLEGVTVGRVVINFETIRRHMRRDPVLCEADLDRLTNPSDTQDVPRAIEFLEAVGRIAELPLDGCTPVELQEIPVIAVIAEMFTSFMDAFIIPDWSLTQQVVSLSKFAHTAFVLFRLHGVNFMPNQLYGDMQTTVKNIFLCIAKQQELDRNQPFYLFWVGDDRLEMLFGRVRMLGAHNPNFSYKNLLDRFGAALDLNAVFARHPHLDPGFRRLKVSRTEHIDHLNPESWRGKAIVGDVDLASAWVQGRDEARILLGRIQVEFDFEAMFASNPKLDMLRPYDSGVYPGVATDSPDRSEEPTPPTTKTSPISISGSTAVASPPTASHSAGNLSVGANCDDVDLPSAIATHAESQSPSLLRDSSAQSETPQALIPAADDGAGTCETSVTEVFELTDEECDKLLLSANGATQSEIDSTVPTAGSAVEPDAAIELEDLLDEPDAAQNSPCPTTAKTFSPWIEYQGRKIHKASICRLVITPDYIRKSHERLLRVRGYSTPDSRRRNFSSDDITDSDAFFTSDLFTTLLRCDNTINLAVLKCLAIEEKGSRVERTRREHLAHAAAGIKLIGQILSLRPLPTTASGLYVDQANTTNGESSASHSGSSESTTPDQLWIWNGDFAQLHLNKNQPAATSKGSRRTIAVKIASHVCSAVNAQVINTHDFPEAVRAKTDLSRLNSAGLTWGFMESELTALVTKLWDIVSGQKLLSVVPTFRINDDIPYRSLDGDPAFVSTEGSETLANIAGNPEIDGLRCYQCGKKLKKGEARNHVGAHILKAMRGVHENLSGQPVGRTMPCGFCGLSNIIDCQQLYITKNGRGQAKSSCSHAHDFQYKTSLTSTVSTPCTNTPVICPIPGCAGEVGSNKTAIWKYNLPEHVRAHHPGYSCDGMDGSLPDHNLLHVAFISKQEESRLGIPDDLIPPKIELEPRITVTEDQRRSRNEPGKRAATSVTAMQTRSKRLRTS